MNNLLLKVMVALATSFVIPLLGQAIHAEDSKFSAIVDFGGFTAGEVVSNSQVKMHMPDADYVSDFRISQKFNYKASHTWTLGLHPVWVRSRKDSDKDWKDYYALDFEANPKWGLSDSLSFSMRNRVAVIWKHGLDDSPLLRFRQKSKFSWKLANKPLGFTSFSVYNEVFWEDERSMITQNRITPVSLSFSPNERMHNSISYGYYSKRIGESSDWKGIHAITLHSWF